MQFLYMGFDQQANTRSFHFQGVQRTERATNRGKLVNFDLTADMHMLGQFKISLQDVPSLCVQILTNLVVGLDEVDLQPATYAITHDHLLAFAASRDAARDLSLSRRKPRIRFRSGPV